MVHDRDQQGPGSSADNSGQNRTSGSDSAGSTPSLEQVLSRLLVDPQFRDRFFSNRQAALSEYPLNDQELASLDLIDERMVDGAGEVAHIVGATCSAFIPPEEVDDAGEGESRGCS